MIQLFFQQEISRVKFKFIDITKLKVIPEYI